MHVPEVCMEWWSSLCDLISLLLTTWGFTWRRGNPQPLWLTGSSWWEGWGSAWSHRIEANPFWFAEDSIYRWHQCLWISCFGSLATFTILAACEKDLERLGGGEGEILPVWSDSHWYRSYLIKLQGTFDNIWWFFWMSEETATAASTDGNTASSNHMATLVPTFDPSKDDFRTVYAKGRTA